MKLGHVHLKVADISSAERFYCGIVGLTVTERVGDSFVFLSFDEEHHTVALQEVSVHEPQPARSGVVSITRRLGWLLQRNFLIL